jgi:subtilisin family serine protease
MKKIAIYLIFVTVSMCAAAQLAPQKYFVEFMDKANSPYSINSPAQYLSYRAIERRQRQGIAIEQNDIPVNQSYVNRLREYSVDILTRSKWFNGVTIYCLNPSIIDTIMQLPFVKQIYKSNLLKSVYKSNSDSNIKSNEVLLHTSNYSAFPRTTGYNSNGRFDYGPSFSQVHMLRGDSMHQLGYLGEGMVIAVLDAGFLNVDVLPAFDSLRIHDQILGTRDFVVPGNNVYRDYEHGTEVLSCMGANLPGELIGTAPHASYWLLRTEDVHSEYLIEEYNWVAAAEFADSAGADIINSSLGYTVFDEAYQNHDCEDMNGNTTPATRGANIASGKGMLVVSSAGNSGAGTWHCVSAPADGYSVLSVAAVDSGGVRAPFSSVGEATRRIKPNVAAMGARTIVGSPGGSIMVNNGTSFSAPLIAGLAACLWQAAPAWSNQSIMRAIELSSNQVSEPDSLLGYGIPDFIKALGHVGTENRDLRNDIRIFPNPFFSGFTLSFHSTEIQEIDINIYNNLGKGVYFARKQVRAGDNTLCLSEMSFMPVGSYVIKIVGRALLLNSKIIKINH